MSMNESVRVLIACDKFKGSLSAAEVAAAVTRGLPAEWAVTACPIADGGEGFVDAMLVGSPGERIAVTVKDALGRDCAAEYGFSNGAAFIEMSAASGLWRIAGAERDPVKASTFGTGQLIRHAVEISAARKIFIGLGGSATNDGGAGMAQALGTRFLDGNGVELDSSPGSLARLEAIDESGRMELPEIVVACDVDHPLCGGRGASAVFGPQKGADEAAVAFLDGALERLARAGAAEAIAEMPGAGAAGGLGFGLVRFAGARLVSGFDLVAEALGLVEKVRSADLVITGEGSLDEQTLGGKGPAGVAAMAREAGIPVVAIAGRAESGASRLFDAVISLQEFGLPKEESISRAGELVEEICRRNQPALLALVKR